MEQNTAFGTKAREGEVINEFIVSWDVGANLHIYMYKREFNLLKVYCVYLLVIIAGEHYAYTACAARQAQLN